VMTTTKKKSVAMKLGRIGGKGMGSGEIANWEERAYDLKNRVNSKLVDVNKVSKRIVFGGLLKMF
jgi:hypothetical protein